MTKQITFYHSPDADDAFMFYGFHAGIIDMPGYSFSHELCDIESLNKRALEGKLDATAISIAQYPIVKAQYKMLSSGASMGGKDYGPRVVSKEKGIMFSKKTGLKIAIPGEFTSTTKAIKAYLKENNITAELVPVFFEEIFDAINKGTVDAGAIIHEGQLTYAAEGFSLEVDLGKWWWDKTGLPLPLGINIVNRNLGEDGMRAVAAALKESITFALQNRSSALDYALSYGRGLNKTDADVFVGMYVNDWTEDLGEKGKESIQLFLTDDVSNCFI